MSFRRSVGREKRPGRRGSRGGFRNRYIVPKDNIGSPVMFLMGEYPDPRPGQQVGGRPTSNSYFLSKDHRKGIKGGQSAIIDLCSAGWDTAILLLSLRNHFFRNSLAMGVPKLYQGLPPEA